MMGVTSVGEGGLGVLASACLNHQQCRAPAAAATGFQQPPKLGFFIPEGNWCVLRGLARVMKAELVIFRCLDVVLTSFVYLCQQN